MFYLIYNRSKCIGYIQSLAYLARKKTCEFKSQMTWAIPNVIYICHTINAQCFSAFGGPRQWEIKASESSGTDLLANNDGWVDKLQ